MQTYVTHTHVNIYTYPYTPTCHGFRSLIYCQSHTGIYIHTHATYFYHLYAANHIIRSMPNLTRLYTHVYIHTHTHAIYFITYILPITSYAACLTSGGSLRCCLALSKVPQHSMSVCPSLLSVNGSRAPARMRTKVTCFF
jgi:hypothetical protein